MLSIVDIDDHVEYSGTPGNPPRWLSCLSKGQANPSGNVLFTEIMYHSYGVVFVLFLFINFLVTSLDDFSIHYLVSSVNSYLCRTLTETSGNLSNCEITDHSL